ncbi:transglycosylase SLT domain-containing protein [Microbacterium thalli]|uniref:Transglycosylase SLT domain-containing protein n=1 Tax=Microbacterium thalli TaxID=3027921 RepID=A0ABT5SIV4_9MICO|nr:transglycosylase SLT domain-containing protein [Microbacterium thalli]MDD7962730.1 transglycosylase SLT domain-containing protein [Microbacterium thalli]
MTPGSELTQRTSTEVARQGARAAGAGPRWSRRRGVVAVFAALAAAGMAGGALAPLGSSLAVAQEKPAEVVSLWAASRGDAQALPNAAQPDAAVALDRSGFTVYVTPKPTPTPTPTPTPEGESDGAGAAPSASVRYSGGGSSTEWLTAAGIPESDWGYVDYIVSRESGWNPNATNASSGACGLVQAYPCSKVPGSGYNPVDNLQWANGYAVGRYGSWAAAHAFWTSNHWW